MATIRKVVQAKNGKTTRVDPEKDQRPALRWYVQVFVGRHATTQRPQGWGSLVPLRGASVRIGHRHGHRTPADVRQALTKKAA